MTYRASGGLRTRDWGIMPIKISCQINVAPLCLGPDPQKSEVEGCGTSDASWIASMPVGFRWGRGDFGKGGVWGCGRPADHDQEYIEDEEGDCDVVEECGLRQIWPELVGRPEEKGDGKHDCLGKFPARRAMHHLVDEVSKSDQRQRESGEEIMASCGKALWKGIPNEQNYDVCQRYDTQDYRKSPVSPVKTK